MIKDKILSTAGVGLKDATLLKNYIELINESLVDRWQVADDFTASHVCFVRNDYLEKISDTNKNKSQLKVIINRKKGLNFYDYKYQLNPPITARKVEYILNKISKEATFEPIEQVIEDTEDSEGLLSSVMTRFKRNILGDDSNSNTKQSIQEKRTHELNRMSQKIDVKDAIENKIVFLGSPGCGKSTIIRTASQKEENQKEMESNTGVDFATMQLNDQVKLSLIGTPGEVDSEFIWDIVGKKANAFVIILDLSRPEVMEYFKKYLGYLKSKMGKVKNLFCVLTHTDHAIEDLQRTKAVLNKDYPFIKRTYVIDPRQKKHVLILLEDIYKHSS